MESISQLVIQFTKSIASGGTRIYNEFSPQHETRNIPTRGNAQPEIEFERSVTFFFPSSRSFMKRELAISVYCPDKSGLNYAIELKYPRNGQYPESMYSFRKDVAFAEELRNAGFRACGLLIFADDSLFYAGSRDGICSYFRAGKPIHGWIRKPIGRRDSQTNVAGTYSATWHTVLDSLRYSVIEVTTPDCGGH
jgi:hypothetical protein